MGVILNDWQKAHYEARASVLKALGHPTRLFIVDELSRGKRCVAELTGMIGADISTVSKHLTILKGEGLIRDEKKGVQVFYELAMPCVLNFFSCVESVLKTNAETMLKVAGFEAGREDFSRLP